MYKIIIRKFKGFIDLLKKRRLFDVAIKLSESLPNWFIMLNKTDMLSFLGEKIKIRWMPKNYIFREANRNDLPHIVCINEDTDDQEYIRKLYRNYFDEGRICYVVEFKNQIVGYCWTFRDNYIVTYDNYRRSNVELIVDNETVFFGDGYIKPAYRLRGAYPVMMSGMIEDSRKKGTKKIIADILSVNDHSKRSHVSLGFSQVNSLYYISILTIDFLIVVDMERKTKVYKADRKIRGVI